MKTAFPMVMTAVCAAFLAFVPGRASGDDLDDFEIALSKVADNYKGAVNAPGSRFAEEYGRQMADMRVFADKVQQATVRAGLGAGFNFTALAFSIDNIYRENSRLYRHPENLRSKKSRGGGKNRKNTTEADLRTPADLLKVLLFDIKVLRRLEFTTENGGGIQAAFETQLKQLEFKRLFDFFAQFRGAFHTAKASPEFKKEFERRKGELGPAARALSLLVSKKNPDAELPCNLTAETELMLKSFDAIEEYSRQRARNPKKKLSPTHEREIRLSIQRINSVLASLRKSGFESDAPRSGAAPGKETPAAADYNSLSKEKLIDELQNRRLRIYRSNTLIDGIDRDTLGKYLTSLSKTERKFFEQSRREYLEKGYDAGLAAKSAVFLIQGQAKLEIEVRELVAILEKMDAEAETERGISPGRPKRRAK